MTNPEIRNLLKKLRKEVENSQLDDETRSLMRELDSDIHDILETESEEDLQASVLNRAREIEANFEAEHPTTVRILSEVVAALSRMGI